MPPRTAVSLRHQPEPIPRRADPSSAPLSFAQEGFWFLEQQLPHSPRHNMAMAMRIAGPLRPAALAEAFRLTVARHEVLRSTIVERQGRPVQVIHAAPAVVLRTADLSAIDPSARIDRAQRLIQRVARRPFDLERGPLLRAALWRLSDRLHLLATSLHHIVGDAWSLQVLMGEVTAAYRRLLAGERAALPPLQVQYGDYAAWDRERLREPLLSTMLNHWASRLDGVAPLDLPSDRRPPAVRTFSGSSCTWRLTGPEVAVLRRLADRERATAFMLVLAAFATLLRRYSHQSDIAVGSPLAVRTAREIQPLIGLFLNTIVFRLHARGAQPVRRFLTHVRDVVIDGLAHGHVPFERVVERVRAGGRPRTLPLFNVMIAARPAPRGALSLPDLQMERMFVREDAAQYDLTLYVGQGQDAVAGVLNYSTELFEPATIERMRGHLTGLLRAIAADPETPLQDLPMLTSGERQQLLADLTGADEPPPAAAGVHELFAQWADATPDAIAMVRDDHAISYAETDRRANAIAAMLIARGVGRGARVAFCLDRRPLMICTLLGILKAGACYLPLDPGFPTKRLRAIVSDARPALLITERQFASIWRRLRRPPIVLFENGDADVGGRMTPPPVASAPDDPAYVIYTSGSTGTPKGVVVPHRALLGSCAAVTRATGIGRGDRFLHYAPIGFDVSAFQILPALTTGATTVLAAPPDELSTDNILDLCRDGLTILDLASAAWQRWIDELTARVGRPPMSIRVYMTGGESTPMSAVRAWVALVDPSALLVSSYGPTESSVTTIWTARAGEVSQSRQPVIPLGQPVRNVRLSIVDAADQLVPVGVSGELCVGGPGLSHGYLDRAADMADLFRPDPGSTAPGARLYRTGDRVRYRGDGVFEFLGRFDQQIKMHGIRIEIGEIERLLRHHPRVHAAVVVAGSGSSTDRSLVAYIVPKDPLPKDPVPDERELRAHLAAHLPRAVLPGAFCFLPALPVTTNGKVDRRALPAPASREARGAGAAARSDTERLVIELWSDVLDAAVIGRDDDFFEMGGHSMSAARVASRLQEAFDVDVPVRTIFEASTPASLARAIDSRRHERRRDPMPPLVRAAREGPVDLSFAQVGFWLLQQFDAQSAAYVNSEVLRLSGDLSPRALAAALSMVVARHESLRTAFIAIGGQPKQVVEPARPVRIPLIDLEAMPSAVREKRAASLGRHEGRRPFDLTRSPLLRVTVLRLGAQDHVLLFTMHHLVADAWSMGLLMEEVSAGYRAVLAGDEPSLPTLPLQYADYSIWQRARWSESALDQAVARRRQQFGGDVPELDLPADRPRPAIPAFTGARHRLSIADDLLAQTRRLGRREGVTPFMSLLAVLKTVLHLYTGQMCVLVAAPVANRALDATDRLLGLFINHVLLVTRFDDDPNGRQLLARVRASTLDAFDDQDLPFDELIRRLRPGRQGSYTPLARVLFNFVAAPRMQLDLPALDVRPAPFSTPYRPRFDMEWTFMDAGDRIAGTIGYDADLFNPSTVERMTNDFTRVLRTFADAPDRPISSLDLMTATQASLALAFNAPL